MSDTVNIEKFDDYIFLKVKGERDNLTQVIEGAERMIEIAEKYNLYNILADYREVLFNNQMADAFNLIRHYEIKLKPFKKINLAMVTTKNHLEIASFHEAIATKRGFSIKVFYNIKNAKRWLVPD